MSKLLHLKVDFLKSLLFLCGTMWITYGAPAGLSQEPLVPEIEACDYLNAYYVNCRWRRPVGETSAQYRLGYFSAADSFEERRERYCEVTQQRDEDGVIIESCGIRGSMYGRFTLFVASVQNCDTTMQHCEAIAKSKAMDFTCMSSNVKLTLPPSTLEIETDIQRLSWYPPEREDSMLSFVLHRRKVLYRVEFRETLEQDKISEWQEWYTGYKTSIFLPILIPGAMYEVRVYASMDPASSQYTVTSSPPMANRQWTVPSNILVFLVPQVMKKAALETTFKEIEKPTVSESTTIGVIGDIVRPVHVSQKIIVASAVTSFVIVLILAIAGYFLPWKRWCCCIEDVKFAKPKMFIDLEESFDHESKPANKSNPEAAVAKMTESYQPITQLFGFNKDSTKTTRVYRGNASRYLTHKRHETGDIEYGRQRLLPPTPIQQLKDSYSLNDLLDHDASSDDVTEGKDSEANIGKGMKRPWEISQSKQNLDTLLKECGDIVEDTPSRYVKLSQDSSENLSEKGLPSYIVASVNSDIDGESILDRSCDYVDETGIDLGFITGGSDITGMMSYGDYDEEKHKEWQRYILDGSPSEFSDSRSDEIPDYVMHAPSLSKEFSQNMSMFVSMATEEVGQQNRLDVDDVTRDLLLKQDDVYDEELHHNDKGSSQFVFVNGCLSNKSSKKNECCDEKDFVNANDAGLNIPVISRRRGSVSGHSVDSGYSPDSPDCVTLNKVESLGSHFEIRGDSMEEETDSDEYMTYVTT